MTAPSIIKPQRDANGRWQPAKSGCCHADITRWDEEINRYVFDPCFDLVFPDGLRCGKCNREVLTIKQRLGVAVAGVAPRHRHDMD